MDKTSKHIGVATELTCLMPIKEGFLPLTDTRTYATRLRAVLKVLNLLRLTARESSLTRPIVDIVDSAGTVYSFTWTIVRERELLLSVVFDRPWEPYIRIVWDALGPFIDLMLCNCRDFSPSSQGFAKFSEFVRTHQVETGFFYAASSLSVDDHRYLAQFERQHRLGRMSECSAATFIAKGAPQSAREEGADEAFLQWMRAFEALYGLRNLFPEESTDHEFLRQAARALLAPSLKIVEDKLAKLEAARTRATTVPASRSVTAALKWFPELKSAGGPSRSATGAVASSTVNPGLIQREVLYPISATSHGCILLARINDRTKLALFSQWLADKVSSAEGASEAKNERASREAWSVAYTFRGLRACGVTESELAQFPKEFREGMEERAGMLGDVRENHPDRWVLPEWNIAFDGELARFTGPLVGETADPRPRVRLSTIDMLITIRKTRCFDSTQEWTPQNPLHDLVLEFCNEARKRGVHVMSVEPLRRLPHPANNRLSAEHFGFADGLSSPQPLIGPSPGAAEGQTTVAFDDGSHRTSAASADTVPLGDVLVGHRNDRGDVDFPPAGSASSSLRAQGSLLHNGSFLVVRKLRQHVATLNETLGSLARSTGLDEEVLRAKMMGRARDGRPLVEGWSSNVPTEEQLKSEEYAASVRAPFTFSGDQVGAVCPWHSHIRRANPRLVRSDSRRLVPTILRRGMPYGPPYDAKEKKQDEHDRGLMFMAYNASIAEQFEIIQRWISGGNTPTENGDVAVFGGQPDPFLGLADADGQPRTFRFVHEGVPHSVELGSRPFVTLQWGLYAFAPSIPAIRSLTGQARPDLVARAGALAAGRRLLAQLRTQSDWMALLEDISMTQSGATAAVCAAINAAHGGVLRTPYGVLVTSRDLVNEVLHNDAIYSVSEYQRRFSRSVGEGFLGMDSGEAYLDESTGPNEALKEVKADQAYDKALEITRAQVRAAIEAAKEAQTALGFTGAPLLLKLDDLIDVVLAKLGQSWFDIPDGKLIQVGGRPNGQDSTLHLPFHLLPSSRYVFSTPNPLPTLEQQGRSNGERLRREVRKWIDARRAEGSTPSAPIARRLFDIIKDDDDRLARTLLGLVFGFLPTVYGNALAVLGQWLDDASLWRLQQLVRVSRTGGAALSYAEATAAIGGALRRAMLSRPVPALLHRTVTQPSRLGDLSVDPNERVVLVMTGFTPGEVEAARPDVTLVFGGDRTKLVHPPHACSGYHIAMGVLTGLFVGMLETHEFAPTPALFTVRVVG